MSEATKPSSRAAEKPAAESKVTRTPQAVAEEMMQQFGSAMRMPSVQHLATAHQKNVEAMVTAQTVLFDGANAVFKRQMEIMQRLAEQAMRAGSEMMTPGADPAAGMEKRVETARKLMEEVVADTQELGTLIGKSQQEAAELLNKRILENLEEMKAAFTKVG